MPLQVPSFPCPGANRRDALEAEDAVIVEEEEEQADDEPGEGAADASEAAPAEMMDLIDAIEEARADPPQLAAVLRQIARRLRLEPGERDMLNDFEGVAQLCRGLADPANAWRGQAMLAFCRASPEICRASAINRGALRDEGAVDGVVEFLRFGLAQTDETVVVAAATALTALCTANDGNKKAAAQLHGEFNEEELAATDADYRTPLFKTPGQAGALDLLLDALRSFPTSAAVQTHACAALRTLLSDDDTRQASCVPSAVENRERAVRDEHFASYRCAVENALACEAGGPRLLEQALLLLRELACRQDRIQELVGLLPRLEAALGEGDARVVRAALAVIRAFAFSDELKERLAGDVVLGCGAAVGRHVAVPAICEQGFGLFANLTMRRPHIASRLNGPDVRVIAVAQRVLGRHGQKPNVVRSVLQTIRNVATQDEAAAQEVKESGLIDEMRKLVAERERDAKWRSPVEIAKQCLREFRADDGLRKTAQYNEYY